MKKAKIAIEIAEVFFELACQLVRVQIDRVLDLHTVRAQARDAHDLSTKNEHEIKAVRQSLESHKGKRGAH